MDLVDVQLNRAINMLVWVECITNCFLYDDIQNSLLQIMVIARLLKSRVCWRVFVKGN